VRIVDNLAMQAKLPTLPLRWDIFCQVVDNLGDIGVCWRLACNLAQHGQSVRLWVDDASALTWMAPQGAPGVQVVPWTTPLALHDSNPGDVLVEAFGCTVASEFIAAYKDCISARGQSCLWFNLEYLTAESYAARCHGLPSPVMNGPGQGLTKHFFYPGFTADTGGLLREADLTARQNQFDRSAWLASCLAGSKVRFPDPLRATVPGAATINDPCGSGGNRDLRLVSLFCYEPAGLATLLDALAGDAQPTCLLVTTGRASAAVEACITDKNRLKPLWNQRETLSIYYLPQLTQTDFDHLLWACDVNFVRGEDSLVRALWAGKPFIWQIYPQDDGAQCPKLQALLDWLHAPESLRHFHLAWNGLATRETLQPTTVPRPDPSTPAAQWLPRLEPAAWQACITLARQQLLQHDDLASQLIEFASKTH